MVDADGDADGWQYSTDWAQPFVGTEKQVSGAVNTRPIRCSIMKLKGAMVNLRHH